MTPAAATEDRMFAITVLGRTLEHLGTQMYKRRDVAIAELVANAWDAGATEVKITVPDPKTYSPVGSALAVVDNGSGMTADQVDDQYLVIGRNRRAAGQTAPKDRRVMGRKGVGKLAGFGLGRTMTVITWRDGLATRVDLDGGALKADGGESKVLEIPGTVGAVPSDLPFETGTQIVMTNLKHKTPPDIGSLHRSLARRFSRTVLGDMAITINDEKLREPDLTFDAREPAKDVAREEVAPGQFVTWWAGFSTTVLPAELQGFTVLVNGKTAQAPPYFFGVEGTASGQHGTKYLTGVIEADFLDAGTDDDSDRISTDRQEIDWEDEAATPLKSWGDALTRRLLRERSSRGEARAEKTVKDDPELAARLAQLDKPSKAQATKFIRALGNAETQQERIRPLADTIVRAFEYRQFHDYIEELDQAAKEPVQLELALEYIQGWKVLESRAILEVVKGRIGIVDKFFSMIVNNASETAHLIGNDNLHDLVASYPWLINPEWQVLAEEKTMSKQLEEWGAEEGNEKDHTRYDFLALAGAGETVVVEIKRSQHAATVEDLQQLERYINKLGQAKDNVRGAFITGKHYALIPSTLEVWKKRSDIDLLTWGDIHKRTSDHYEHYKAILDSDLNSDNFDRKVKEVALTRSVLDSGSSYRTPADRAGGLGPQDKKIDD